MAYPRFARPPGRVDRRPLRYLIDHQMALAYRPRRCTLPPSPRGRRQLGVRGDPIVLRETVQTPELGGRPDRQQHGHALARLSISGNALPGECAEGLQGRAETRAERVLGEAVPVPTVEVPETTRRYAAALQIDQDASCQRRANRVRFPP